MSNPQHVPQISNVACVVHEMTPYRVHKLTRFARELPGIRILTFATNEIGTAPWSVACPPEINYRLCGEGIALARRQTPSSIWRDIRRGRLVCEQLMRQQVRAVVVFSYFDPVHVRIIAWCRLHGIPCFLWGDSNISNDTIPLWKLIVKKLLVGSVLRLCYGAMACGSRGRAYFRKYGVPDRRIYIVPNEPDYSAIEDLSQKFIEEVRERYALDQTRRRIVFSGRLIPLKRVDWLIRAFDEIAERRPQWDLLIVGDGPLHDDLRRQVPEALATRVRFVGFVGDSRTLGAIYRNCHVLALPSDYEAWALVLNEAAAAGLALVASDVVGAAPELIRPNVNGWTFPTNDQASLSARLLDVTDPGTLVRFASASRDVLADWRRRADPVEGFRQAMRSCGVL